MRTHALDAHHLSEHPSPGRQRLEAWTALQRTAERLDAAEIPRGAERETIDEAARRLATLAGLERFWARPGKHHVERLAEMLSQGNLPAFAREVYRAAGRLALDPVRAGAHEAGDVEVATDPGAELRCRATVLVVDDLPPAGERHLVAELEGLGSAEDDLAYDVLVVGSLEEAVFAITFNGEIQACVLRDAFPERSEARMPGAAFKLEGLDLAGDGNEGRGVALGRLIADLRPEVDLYLSTDTPVEDLEPDVHRIFERVFYRREHLRELHLSILAGLRARYDTPFFSALRRFSRQPTGVFHALPISRGNSVFNSRWIHDMGEFYGPGLFLAETSTTSGGLDSLLQPRGPLREAQEAARRAFGSQESFFVTNGTSTANKMVIQALVRPGDIVLVDRNCHKSHHYAILLAGAEPYYLDPYPLEDYAIYGAVTVREVKRALLDLRRRGQLERARLLILTNCTFDGLVLDPRRIMEEALAIAPHLCFLWDEAWFAFAVCTPTYRRRTGMHAAKALADALAQASPSGRAVHTEDDEALLDARLYPDPERARVRVYVTQSTHKSLSALRQGSMIHVHDQDFGGRVAAAFEEAYLTHTSTSPNYQILASLDVARRQVELEGFELVQSAIEKAVTIRRAIRNDPILSRHFRVLGVPDLIPRELSPALQPPPDDPTAFAGGFRIERAWQSDELVLDPTRVTLFTAATGIDGATFRDDYLMARLGVQVNKTSPNSVLFMTGIGTTWSSVAFLLDGLRRLGRELEHEEQQASPAERELLERRRRQLVEEPPPLPGFSGFARAFTDDPHAREGDMRRAFFLGLDQGARDHLSPTEAAERAARGDELISAGFVIPYPPGFPVLVPGQVVDAATAELLAQVDVDEIHGYNPEIGIPLIAERALEG
jgi:arginine decarboxylase